MLLLVLCSYRTVRALIGMSYAVPAVCYVFICRIIFDILHKIF